MRLVSGKTVSIRRFSYLIPTCALWALAVTPATAEVRLAKGFTTLQFSSAPIAAKSTVRLHHWVLQRDGEPGSRIDLVLAAAPKGRARVTIIPLARQGAGRVLFQSSGCPTGALVANGGFYLRDERGARPLGLLRANGQTLSPPSGRRFGGFLTSEGAGPSVLRRSQRDLALSAKFAIESSPIVIEHGLSGIKTDNGERFDRVGVGVTREHATVVAGAFADEQNSVTLAEFARLAASAITRVGERPADMLAMDGGPSAHLYVAGSAIFFGSKGAAYVPNVICLDLR